MNSTTSTDSFDGDALRFACSDGSGDNGPGKPESETAYSANCAGHENVPGEPMGDCQPETEALVTITLMIARRYQQFQ